MGRPGLERPLVLVALALALFGVLMVYSAGQTDVHSVARNAWTRQIVWIGVAMAAAAGGFRVNFRPLEWAAPFVYALGILLLVLTLLIGTGSGTAAGSKSWLPPPPAPRRAPARRATSPPRPG